MSKKEKKEKEQTSQPLLPAAQQELDQKVQNCTRATYHAEAYSLAELIMKGMKMQAIRSVAENSEVLKIAGFNRLEDFFDSLGIKRRQGFYLKKIAEAFSDEEVQTLHSMRFSRQDILRLASLPAGSLPDIESTEDPEELKATIHGLLTENEKIKDISQKVARDNTALHNKVKNLEKRIPNRQGLDWAWEAVERISLAVSEIQTNMSLLLDSQDPRLVNNPEFKSRISGLYQTSNQMLTSFFDKVEQLTGYRPEKK